MDWCLIGYWIFEWATWSWVISPTSWLVIFLVALGLGMVIFVHELGHFAVAKLCGVKCEKFYLGFDIAGWKICKFKWGETEYGIGVLPLGGYVKMLGQEDNPARLKEEIERAKAAQDYAPSKPGDSGVSAAEVAAAEAALYDPRSYLAQSVPKRMAIISAGVIMNLIFAFVAATAAYLIGVNEWPCEVGSLQPGDPAWQAHLKPGDRLIEINGKPTYRYRDLLSRIPLSDTQDGVSILVERPGLDEPIALTLHPNRERLVPAIGIGNPFSCTLRKSTEWLNSEPVSPHVPGSPVGRATPAFEPGDTIVAIDGTAVGTNRELREALWARRAKDVGVTVEREGDDASTQRLTIEVGPRPMWTAGMIMRMGAVSAVQEDSPAARAGVLPDDEIVAIDGDSPGDPMTLPDRLWTKVREAVASGDSPPTVTLTIRRRASPEAKEGESPGNEEETLDISVATRDTDAYEIPHLGIPNSTVSVPSLGIAYRVGNTVEAVLPDGPAARAGIEPGDVLTKATFSKPDAETLEREDLKPGDVQEVVFDLAKYEFDWPRIAWTMQEALPGTEVIMEFQGDKAVSLVPVEASDWFNPERGFLLHPVEFTLRAKTLGEALRLGGEETFEQATAVLRFLHRLATRELSPRAFGGPIMIARVAGAAVTRGISEYLILLTTISATLAVINFLPIPILDGGHFVFLLYEGIRRKPADERVQLILSYAGLLLILGLMVWVIGLDLNIIPRE